MELCGSMPFARKRWKNMRKSTWKGLMMVYGLLLLSGFMWILSSWSLDSWFIQYLHNNAGSRVWDLHLQYHYDWGGLPAGKTHLPNPRAIMFLMRSRTVKTSQHSGQWLMDGCRSVHELPRGNKTVLDNERLPRKIIRSKDKQTSKMEWDCQLPLLWWSCCGLPPVVRTP